MIDRNDIQALFNGFGRAWPYAEFLYLKLQDVEAAELLRKVEIASVNALSENNEANRTNDVLINIALSHNGLSALMGTDPTLDELPEAFRQGMRSRADLIGDVSSNAPECWDSCWAEGPVNGLLMCFARSREALKKKTRQLAADITKHSGIELVGQEFAEKHFYGEQHSVTLSKNAQAPADGDLIEHFGFRDGISNPPVEGFNTSNPPGSGKLSDRGWQPVALGEFLLGHLDEVGEVHSVAAPQSLGFNGSFLVFRKLEQDVATFRAEMERVASVNGVCPDFVASKLVGRNRDGSPLGGASEFAPPYPPGRADNHRVVNDFRFIDDPKGNRCPVSSHIRRTNPRDMRGFSTLLSDRHRLLRRGISYGPPYDPGRKNLKINKAERGLFFLALCTDLERQFEFVQSAWMNDGDEFSQGNAVDPISGTSQGKRGDRTVIIPRGINDGYEVQKAVVCNELAEFVTTKGGEYFLLPGLAALRRILKG